MGLNYGNTNFLCSDHSYNIIIEISYIKFQSNCIELTCNFNHNFQLLSMLGKKYFFDYLHVTPILYIAVESSFIQLLHYLFCFVCIYRGKTTDT